VKLLLLPGMDGTGKLFDPLLAVLPAALPVRVVSYPADRPLNYDELLPLVEDAAAGLGEFVVVGESFSGPLALMLAGRRPSGLRGVVLSSSFIRFPLPRWFRVMIRPWGFQFVPQWLMARLLLGRHRRGSVGRLLSDAVRSVTPTTMAARAKAMVDVDVTTELRVCPVPLLYLRGFQDRVIGRKCWTLIRSIRPDTELVEVPGPHLLLQAAPADMARVLVSFCDRVSQRAPSIRPEIR